MGKDCEHGKQSQWGRVPIPLKQKTKNNINLPREPEGPGQSQVSCFLGGGPCFSSNLRVDRVESLWEGTGPFFETRRSRVGGKYLTSRDSV